VSDSLGRVILIDNLKGLAIRMWKGMYGIAVFTFCELFCVVAQVIGCVLQLLYIPKYVQDNIKFSGLKHLKTKMKLWQEI
jgi:hypothetical protein